MMPDWSSIADQTRRDIAEKALPFWFDQAFQNSRRGYTLGYDAFAGPKPEADKLIVSQARLVWLFSRAHRLGYSTAQRNYLSAARHGIEFLDREFRDILYGGYRWLVRPAPPHEDQKILYGHCFVLYGLVQFSLAGGIDAIGRATELFDLMDAHFRDREQGGWVDSLAADWSAPGDEPLRGFDYSRKSANTVLHLIEALCALHEATAEESVAETLREALEIADTRFFPADPMQSIELCHPDGRPVRTHPHDELSFGHMVEFAWLREEARLRLGLPAEQRRVDAYLDYVLNYGLDHSRGGIYSSALPNQLPTKREKSWWEQCELIAALSRSIRMGSERYLAALRLELDWMNRFGRDATTTLPFSSVNDDGTPTNTLISHAWNAGYHDLRSRWMLIEAIEAL